MEEQGPTQMTRADLMTRLSGLAALLLAVVALLLGYEIVAVLAFVVAVGLIAVGGSGKGSAWGNEGQRWSTSDSDFEDLVNDVQQQASKSVVRPAASGDPHDASSSKPL